MAVAFRPLVVDASKTLFFGEMGHFLRESPSAPGPSIASDRVPAVASHVCFSPGFNSLPKENPAVGGLAAPVTKAVIHKNIRFSLPSSFAFFPGTSGRFHILRI